MNLTEAVGDVAARGSGRGVRLFSGDEEVERASFEQLHDDAGHLARGLLDRGVVPGERIALALPTSIDFVRGFLGILAAGAVPVPVPPPFRFAALDIHMRRIATALRQSAVRRVLSNAALGGLLGPALGDPGEFAVLDVAATRGDRPAYVRVAGDRPALVQYTSGTVADPKGVVLSHANLLANVAAIAENLRPTEDDVCCTWLPLFHDMGLIGSLLTALLNDVEICMLPPEDFLRDPARWLRVISRHGGSLTAAPNSGYLHTLRRIPAERVSEFDLSRWRLALNGAENIDADLQRRFAAHFAPAGFRPNAFLPVYGLAEGSLAVTFAPPGRPVRSTWVRRDLLGEGVVADASAGAELAREVVSVGTPVRGTEVRLLAADGSVVHGDDGLGEIQIRGASVSQGYEADPAPAGEQAGGTIGDARWVSTGDLAFRRGGEYFVAGRKKEMVIVLGANYYASDIESVVAAVPGVSVHGALAAGVAFPDGEGLVLFVETAASGPEERRELAGQVRLAVSGALGISPREVLLVGRGRLPRTSSGKLRRHDVAGLYAEHGPPAGGGADTGERRVEIGT